MRNLLTQRADEIGRETGFIKRQRCLSGSSFAQTLVMGWMYNPSASLSQLASLNNKVSKGKGVSIQALEQRFSKEAGVFLQKLLEEGVSYSIERSDGGKGWEGLADIEISDSTVISLPSELKEVFKGCGAEQAGLKAHVRLNLRSGALHGPMLGDARRHDRNSPVAYEGSQGSIQLRDLGLFKLQTLVDEDSRGVSWISRLPNNTRITLPTLPAPQQQKQKQKHKQQTQNLAEFLKKQKTSQVDVEVIVGAQQQLPCRLIALKVPSKVYKQRLQRLKDTARRRQKTISKEDRLLLEWDVRITNLSQEQLPLQAVLLLSKLRWQIELLFKLWKQHFLIDQWRSENPQRILCEVLAKLIAALIQHWLLLAASPPQANYSFINAALNTRWIALYLIDFLQARLSFSLVLQHLKLAVAKGCTMQKRRAKPNSYQIRSSISSLN